MDTKTVDQTMKGSARGEKRFVLATGENFQIANSCVNANMNSIAK